jgi:hypothetical protein
MPNRRFVGRIIFGSTMACALAGATTASAGCKPQVHNPCPVVREIFAVTVQDAVPADASEKSLIEGHLMIVSFSGKVTSSLLGAPVDFPAVTGIVCSEALDGSGCEASTLPFTNLKFGSVFSGKVQMTVPTASSSAPVTLRFCRLTAPVQCTTSDPTNFKTAARYYISIKSIQALHMATGTSAVSNFFDPHGDTLAYAVNTKYLGSAAAAGACVDPRCLAPRVMGKTTNGFTWALYPSPGVGPFDLVPDSDGDIAGGIAILNFGASYAAPDRQMLLDGTVTVLGRTADNANEAVTPDPTPSLSALAWRGCDGPLNAFIGNLSNTGPGGLVHKIPRQTAETFVSDVQSIPARPGCDMPKYRVTWSVSRN